MLVRLLLNESNANKNLSLSWPRKEFKKINGKVKKILALSYMAQSPLCQWSHEPQRQYFYLCTAFVGMARWLGDCLHHIKIRSQGPPKGQLLSSQWISMNKDPQVKAQKEFSFIQINLSGVSLLCLRNLSFCHSWLGQEGIEKVERSTALVLVPCLGAHVPHKVVLHWNLGWKVLSIQLKCLIFSDQTFPCLPWVQL